VTSLVDMRATGERPPLVWAHGISGRAGHFRPFVPRLAETRDIYGLENHACPEPSSLEEMGARYAAAIDRRRPGGPYEIFGYSLGGLIALETARQLTALGREVTLVGLLDTAPPTVAVAPETVAVTVSLVARGLGLPPPADAGDDPVLELSRHAVEARVLPAGLAVAYIRAMVATYTRNGEAADAYRPPPYHGPVALLFTETGDAVRHRDLWRRFAPNVVAEDVVALDHFALIGEAADSVIDIVERWQQPTPTDWTSTMQTWIETLFTGLLPEPVITAAVDDYDTYRDVALTELGLESLAVMQVAIRMADLFGHEIDYDDFQFGSLRTLGTIESQLRPSLVEA
jgi:thioesterase domain-containing protein